MTRDDIIRMAQGAGCVKGHYPMLPWLVSEEALERFFQAAYAAGAAAEREPVAHSVIAGALFDFMGWLTTRKERLALSRADNASPAADAIKDFAKMRGLSLDDARVLDWQDYTTPPAAQRPWVGLTEEEIDNCWYQSGEVTPGFARAIEAKLKERNT
jgi:hypothetical protein